MKKLSLGVLVIGALIIGLSSSSFARDAEEMPAQRYFLTIIRTGSGIGVIEADPPPGTDGKYGDGVEVILTATADVGSAFVEWSGDGTGSDDFGMVTMDSDKSVEARFDLKPDLTLKISKIGDGTVKRDGVALTLPYSATVAYGTAVALEATTNYNFFGWTGSPEIEAINYPPAVSMVLTDDIDIAARFESPSVYNFPPHEETVELGGGYVMVVTLDEDGNVIAKRVHMPLKYADGSPRGERTEGRDPGTNAVLWFTESIYTRTEIYHYEGNLIGWNCYHAPAWGGLYLFTWWIDHQEKDGNGPYPQICVPDFLHAADLDDDDIPNVVDPDDDGDGAPDTYEVEYGTDPEDDSDFDEVDYGTDPVDPIADPDDDNITNVVDPDDDGDGTADIFEEYNGADPLDPDSNLDMDGDGVSDNNDADMDGDGSSNLEEELNGKDPTDPDSDIDM